MPKTDCRPGRTAMLVTIALLLTLPACFCLRRFYPMVPVFEGRAVVRNAAGVEVVVTTTGDPLMDLFVMATAGEYAGALERATSKFKRALNSRLTAGGSEMFRARFGEGPWCLTAEPAVLLTFEHVDPATLGAEGGIELPLCAGPPPPPVCAEPGEMPILQVDPPSWSFGDVPLGSTSPPASFNIENGGTGYICLASMIAGGRDAFDFEIDDADCRPTDPEMARQFIGPDGRTSCTVNVTFAPKRPGDREGTLRISSNAQPVLQEFGLTGRGLAGSLTLPPTPVCVPRGAPHPPYLECFEREIRLPNPGPGAVTVRYWDATIGWRWGGCTPLGLALPPESEITCHIHACGTSPPEPGAILLASDGVGVDPTATVIEIPVIAQVTPSTCTP